MWFFLAFAFGLVVGSFLNVCIYRIPAKQSVVLPPSRCPGCGRRLGAAELLPVVSYLWQRAKCRQCGSVISRRYPLVELSTGILFAVLLSRFGWPEMIFQAIFYSILLVIFFVDLDHQIIPNRLVLLLLGLAAVAGPAGTELPWRDALLGALLGGGLFFLLAVVSRGGMGGGDIKLVFVLGLWFGWAQLLLLMFLAFFAGGAVGGALLLLGKKGRKDGIPFGPFLVLAAFTVSMWGERLLSWYLRLGRF